LLCIYFTAWFSPPSGHGTQEAQGARAALEAAEARCVEHAAAAEASRQHASQLEAEAQVLRAAAAAEEGAPAGQLAELEAELAGAREAAAQAAEAARQLADAQREVTRLRCAGMRAAELEARLADRERRLERLRTEARPSSIASTCMHAAGCGPQTCLGCAALEQLHLCMACRGCRMLAGKRHEIACRLVVWAGI
jgi:hypothetical protein